MQFERLYGEADIETDWNLPCPECVKEKFGGGQVPESKQLNLW